MNNKLLKVLTIVGARPQFIKAAVVSRLMRQNKNISEKIIHTGQHYDSNLSNIFFEELEIPMPDYNLGIGSGNHGYQTGQMIEKIEPLIMAIKPDLVLVYGDTNSTLAGAIVSVKAHIPVVHIEAGLRSFNRKMPEEINRILTDHCSSFLFAPTETAVNNLLAEGIKKDIIYFVGDVMYDASLYYSQIAEKRSKIIEKYKLRKKQYILVTIHRAENTDDYDRLNAIVDGLSLLAAEVPVIFPMHPRTMDALMKFDLAHKLSSKILFPGPVGYLDMLMLEKYAALITTDSGGVQKEAYFFQVPCVTLREETEWVELVESGWNYLLAPLSGQDIMVACIKKMRNQGCKINLFGNGRAANKILEVLVGGKMEI